MENRVAVTGFGVITPFGYGVQPCEDGVFGGKHGFRPITRFSTDGCFATRGAEAPEDVQPTYRSFAIHCVDEALRMAGLSRLEHRAILEQAWVAIGNLGDGGMLRPFYEQLYRPSSEQAELTETHFQLEEELVPIHDRNPFQHAEIVAKHIGSKAPRIAFTNACIASANAIAYGYNQIRKGRCELAIVGGINVLHPLVYYNFDSSRAMADEVVRPFSKDRTGLLIGDGAAVLVLESLRHAESRNAKPLVEIVGCGLSADGYHVTQPEPEGRGLARAMERALKQAGLQPEQIDYVNAHGTGTPLNDKSETKALRQVFGEYAAKLPVSSTKSTTGHMLEATGAVEAVISMLSLIGQRIPPTANALARDDELDLDYVFDGPRTAKVRRVMSNSAAFGGNNCSIIFQKA